MIKYYAFRIYENNKRTNKWIVRLGKISTGRGRVFTDEELLEFEKLNKVKRITKNKIKTDSVKERPILFNFDIGNAHPPKQIPKEIKNAKKN